METKTKVAKLKKTEELEKSVSKEELEKPKEIEQPNQGKIENDVIDEPLFSNYLSFNHLPNLDLIIRTSGETRLSNFMLWEAAYSEIHFTETLWPNFEEQITTVDEIDINYSHFKIKLY